MTFLGISNNVNTEKVNSAQVNTGELNSSKLNLTNEYSFGGYKVVSVSGFTPRNFVMSPPAWYASNSWAMAKKADGVITNINDTLRIPRNATILSVVYKNPDGPVLQIQGSNIAYSLQLNEVYSGAIMAISDATLVDISTKLDNLDFALTNIDSPYLVTTQTLSTKESVLSCVMTSTTISQVTSGSIEVIITYAIAV